MGKGMNVAAAPAVALALVLACALGGCASNENRPTPSGQQGMAEVLQEQTGQVEKADVATSETLVAQGFSPDTAPAFARVDFDLTTMGPEMVYATVYDMMTNPAAYEGKTVRMVGPYYHTYYDVTDQDYFYVIIQDATACCSQGLEFVWGDGSRIWPDEYPEDGHELVVTGVFETYNEGTSSYAHLVGASVEDA